MTHPPGFVLINNITDNDKLPVMLMLCGRCRRRGSGVVEAAGVCKGYNVLKFKMNKRGASHDLQELVPQKSACA